MSASLSTGGIISTIGGAVGSLFTGEGNAAEANSYTSAASLEEQNAQLTAASTRIQETQTARAVSQTLGTQQADVAGAGFTESGSALDLMKSSAQQGALAKSLVNIQGAINENAYAAEAGADTAKAKAANEAQTASTIGAIASIGGALVNGTTQLASAGNTIASGVNYVGGLLNPTATAQTTAGIYSESQGGYVAGGGLTDSTLDTSISDTSTLYDTSIAADTTIDTSGLVAGETTAVADAGISDAIAASAVDAAAVDAGAADAAAAAGTDIFGTLLDVGSVLAC